VSAHFPITTQVFNLSPSVQTDFQEPYRNNNQFSNLAVYINFKTVRKFPHLLQLRVVRPLPRRQDVRQSSLLVRYSLQHFLPHRHLSFDLFAHNVIFLQISSEPTFEVEQNANIPRQDSQHPRRPSFRPFRWNNGSSLHQISQYLKPQEQI